MSYLGSSLFLLVRVRFLALSVFCFSSQFLVCYQQFLSKISWFPFASFIELRSDLSGQKAQFQLAFHPSGSLSKNSLMLSSSSREKRYLLAEENCHHHGQSRSIVLDSYQFWQNIGKNLVRLK